MPEIVFEPSLPFRRATHARSTVLLASRAAIVAAGHGADYLAALDGPAARALDEAVAGVWLPIEVAQAHYHACDALKLGANTVAQIGRSTNDRLKGALYGTFIRVYQEVGGSPWSVLPHWQRFWDRGYDGGAVRVTKLGPKDARVDVFECCLFGSDYFRHALRGLTVGFIEVFCQRAYAQVVGHDATEISVRYQWA